MTAPLTAIRRRSRTWAAAVLAGGLLAIAPGTWVDVPQAQAHDSVIGGTIETDDVVEELPDEITLEFSGIPQEGFNTIAVSNLDTREVLFSGEPTLNERNLTIDVPDGLDPQPGAYQVGFSITSSDGHATRGAIPFTIAGEEGAGVEGDGGGETSVEPGTMADDGGLEGPVKWIAATGGVLALVAVAAVLIAKRRTLGEGQ